MMMITNHIIACCWFLAKIRGFLRWNQKTGQKFPTLTVWNEKTGTKKRSEGQ